MKKITFKNEDRQAIIRFLDLRDRRKEFEKKEAQAKKACEPIFKALGSIYHGAGEHTDYIAGSIQTQGEPEWVLYTETRVSGRIDWEAYARTLPGFDEAVAETFRKPDSVREDVKRATKMQSAELNK